METAVLAKRGRLGPDVEDRFRSKGRLTLRITNFSHLARCVDGGKRYSEVVFIRGLPWRIFAVPHEPKIVPMTLAFYLQCNVYSSDHGWECMASATLRLKSLKVGQKDITKNINHRFHADENDWGYPAFFRDYALLLDPANGWVDRSDVLTLIADVSADLPYYGIERFELDAPDTLFVRGVAIPVNKHSLAAQSPFFRSLFFSDFREKRNDHFELNDPDSAVEDIKLLIELSDCWSKRKLAGDKIEIILALSEQYLMPYVREKCLLALDKYDMSAFIVYGIAHRFKLQSCKTGVLRKLNRNNFFDTVKKYSADYWALEDCLRLEILDHISSKCCGCPEYPKCSRSSN